MVEGATARLLDGMRLATLVITVTVLFGLYLPMLVTNTWMYRSPAVEAVVFVVLAGVTAVIGATNRTSRVLLVVVFVGAVVATAAVEPRHLVGSPHGADDLSAWLGVLLLWGRPIHVLVGYLAAGYAVAPLQLWSAGLAEPEALARLAISNFSVFGLPFAVGVAVSALRRMVVTATRIADEQERHRTAEVMAEQLHADRQQRYAGLTATTVPLLAGLSGGGLDPADDGVRQRCAAEAARMRRLLAEHDDTPDPLLHELRACIEVAERRGLVVRFAVMGACSVPPLGARRALTEPVLAVLSAARSSARVTVARRASTVTVSVVADAPASAAPNEGKGLVSVTRLPCADRLGVRAIWHHTGEPA
ncbi:hypothetical protein NLX83_37575 [Allokutzneria sp. A3M-2-11 16]|uniref:hypothetical protein n=1 Tax=Allokutzneria sp. A3M-2-11 16 TaxID=2962043 RepID=UPI0020B6E7F8|nr:hypothetical protein [Allokutzneria sp. A3M-2-11 16]MCP3804993.1 hypothetical protein [Allokutzneria sp. A3M-2-11 16]